MLQRLHRLARLLRTSRHLKPSQLFYFAWYRGTGMRRVTPPPVAPPLRRATIPALPPGADGIDTATEYRFEFLNQAKSLPRAAMNWRPADVMRLWRYNLHYFDYLADPQRPLAQKRGLLDDWIRQNPQGSKVAWEPYTASLRIVNWCKFLAAPAGSATAQQLLSLYTQALWLEKNLELHILANHYFENIKALIFAGAFFDDAASARWLRYGQQRLREQLREQTLADGGHYERSPQYHCIMLEGYLDLYALARANPDLFAADLIEALALTARDGLALLRAIATPDDDIPIFNDSAHKAAPVPSALFAHAGRLDLAAPATAANGGIDCPATGLFGWKNAHDYFLIDCGDIGPAYQPGHTHCDFLSYVLMLDGQWLVVDTGVCEYEPGAMRRYVRATAAHNTITVDEREQSEIWGEFRVGHRAQRLAATLHEDADGCVFDGAYRGFADIPGGIVHRRRAALAAQASTGIAALAIEDGIEGEGEHTVQNRIHLHPQVSARIENSEVRLYRNERWIATLRADTAQAPRITLEESWYCPEFGVKIPNTTICLELQGPLPLRSAYRIERAAQASA